MVDVANVKAETSNRKRYFDLAERVILTFLGAFIAVYLASVVGGESAFEILKSGEILDKAFTAGVAALVPLATGLVGFRVGNKDTASVLSVREDPAGGNFIDQDVPQESPAPLVEDQGY